MPPSFFNELINLYMRTRQPKQHTFLSAAAATGAGTVMRVSEYRHLTIELSTASSADLTVLCKGAVITAPTFTSAASPTNAWSAIGMYDYEDATLKDGDTGIVLTGTDDTMLLTVNTDGLDYLNFDVTAYVAGALTVKGVGYTNV